uniref:Uncharacterized protein n=1 Tax=Panagrolaimus sp. PS1159 TaxID=55785 RepID=A0AC35ERT3_9BILA
MTRIKTSYCGESGASCKPIIGEEDNRITIIVKEIHCDTFIKNARIYYPPTTTTTSTSLPSTNAPSETSNASNEWYIWVIIGIAFVFIIGIIIAIFVCWKKQICLFEKKTEAKKRITITDTADPQIITKAEDVPEPQPESKPETQPKTPVEEISPPPKVAKKSKKKSKKSKKGKKEKKPAKKDTKDDPIPPETPVVDAADHVTLSKEPDSVAPPPPPPPPPPQVASFPLSLKEQQVFDEDYYTP